MRIDHPSPCHIPQLRQLWKDAFGDPDVFLDSFFRTAYAPDRCRCILVGDEVAAVLYWLDCSLDGRKLAYIYAVVTHPGHRGKGLCRMLMEDTHALLAARNYDGTLLVPQTESLRQMYAGMGYRNAGGLAELSCTAGDKPVSVAAIGPAEFAALRRTRLPAHAVIQEGGGLLFLSELLQFYKGDDFLLAAYAEGSVLQGVELLGNTGAAPGIVNALGCRRGSFRCPGNEKPFAMFHPLTETAKIPEYFGFAFD